MRAADQPSLEGQKVGEFRDLAVQPVEHRVAAGDLARQEELRQHEHREEEDD